MKKYVLPSQKDDILIFNQYMKSDKTPYMIYADLESLIKKIDACANNPEKSSTTKIGEHIPLRIFKVSLYGHVIIQKISIVFFISICSSLSISFIDTIIGLKNSSSISFFIF